MNSYYSILKFVSNTMSGEYIVIGLILVSENKVLYKFSDDKITIANKLRPDSKQLIDFFVYNFNDYIKKQNLSNLSDFKFLNRLSIYNNGIIQITKPSKIKMVFNEENFESLFNNII